MLFESELTRAENLWLASTGRRIECTFWIYVNWHLVICRILSIEHLDFGLSFIQFSNTHLFVTYISLTLITWPLGGSGMTKQGTIILPQTDLNSPFLCSYACLQLRGVWPDAWNDHRRGVFTLTIAPATYMAIIACCTEDVALILTGVKKCP